MLKRYIGVAVAALLLSAAAAQAQENATLILKSGEQISGQLVDLGGVGYTVRVGGQDRQIPQDQVAEIDFGTGAGTPTGDWANKLSSGQNVVELRSGQTFAGHIYDISGTSPLKITFDTDSGRRDVSSSEISRIYLAPRSGTAATTGTTTSTTSAPAPAGAITVAANQQWTPTGINVRKGEVIRFQSTGQIQLSGNSSDMASPSGAMSQRKAAGSPLPNEFAGALIAKIGVNGQPFPIGGQTSVPMPAAGALYLGINDDAVGDNTGQFYVAINRGRR